MRTPEDSTRGMGYPRIGGGIAQRMTTDFPNIESTVRIFKQNQAWFRKDETRYLETGGIFADSTFLKIFSYQLISGDRKSGLDAPYSMLLSEEMAVKYFGTTDAVGEIIEWEVGRNLVPFEVKGVFGELPVNSHFHFDFVGSMSTYNAQFNNPPFLRATIGNAFFTYLLLPEGTDPETIGSQLPAFVNRHHPPGEQKFVASYFMQPLEDIHLNSNLLAEFEQNGNVTYIYIFIVVAILTLIIACINFMNLATARSSTRAKEVGIRKVVGAFRMNLIKQFIGESLMMSFAALIIALCLTAFTLPYFNDLAGKSLSVNIFANPVMAAGLIGVALFVGFFSGSYPALFLSAFKPAEVLKGKMRSGSGRALVRKILVLSQFVISISFIIGTIIILNQINFIKNRDLGFERYDRVTIPLNIVANSMSELQQKKELLKEEYLRNSGVEFASVTSGVPTQLRGISAVRSQEMSLGEEVQIAVVNIDYDYISALDMEITKGRDYSRDIITDSTEAIILNETAARQLGLIDPVGSRVLYSQNLVVDQNTSFQYKTVIGVLKDLHFEPLHRQIAPMMLMINTNNAQNILVKMNPDNVTATMNYLRQKWEEIVPEREFMYTFLDDDFNLMYQSEDKLSSVLRNFTLLVIFIACLGLFGLASFMAEQRTKEIGIRKVLGASIGNIVWNLSKEFSLLVILANLFAWPAAYYFADNWLQGFYYRVGINPVNFILSGVIALLIALVTVSYQAVKAALMNPVETLKYE
jgi:putative ABC transport system permease protein